jgi:hypothetical protein
MKVWEKHQNNKFGYGIQTFPKNKVLLFHAPSKFNVLQCHLFFLFPKDIHKKNSPMFYSNSNGDKNYVI